MKQIILTKGLPASGKSTWAKNMVEKHPGVYKRVNKDDLRAMLDNSRWSKGNEKFVLKIRDYIVREALREGKHVIIDDTNLEPYHEIRMHQIADEVRNTKVIIQDFTDVSVEECVKRDLTRYASVGERVIREMYTKYLKPRPNMPAKNPNLEDCVICDLDGTLCLYGERNPYERDFINDEPNEAVLDVLSHYIRHSREQIIFFSGRNDKFRDETLKWLEIHVPDFLSLLKIGRVMLHMRSDGDFKKDNELKKEMYMKFIDGRYNVKFVIDDRKQVVDMWRNELGLTVFQVADGDF